MKIYTYEVRAHNTPADPDPVASDGQGVIGVDMQPSANESEVIEDGSMEETEDKKEAEFPRVITTKGM